MNYLGAATTTTSCCLFREEFTQRNVFRSRALVWPSPQKLCEGGIFWEENKKEKRIRRKKIWGQTAAANCRNFDALTSRARERNLSSTSSIELAHESLALDNYLLLQYPIDRRILYLWDIFF